MFALSISPKWMKLLQSPRHLVIFSASALVLLWLAFNNSSSSDKTTLLVQTSALVPRSCAYALILKDDTYGKNKGDENDLNYVQARVIIWQLLHDPQTRTAGYPVVIIASEAASERKRRRLEDDGAIVITVPNSSEPLLPKLQLANLVQYERILYLDSNTWLTRPLDGIFEDDAAQPSEVLSLTTSGEHNSDLPRQYVFAATASVEQYNHTFPPQTSTSRPNMACVVIAPSFGLFDYYKSIAATTEYSSDHDLWTVAHLEGSAMPWKKLEQSWSSDWSTYEDYKRGIAALHTKSWENTNDLTLRFAAMEAKWKMEGFWEAIDGERLT